ncbi:hypothetical protein LTR70_007001 [Exophiala xenobiotica]|uniref:Uncharacterized protein n=1 Tax=Lithohypha guttulata TaxID=1690604 RepID=A0ABR0K581_9EURO|nr:hypothetical protein LTR24_006881 [Lithohypha guttulata]KAK5314702.1 hypothetical protein LTR70_007001 [Exophiala xenobiotica]
MNSGRRRKRCTARSRSPQASSTETARSRQSYQPNLWTWIDHVPQSRDDQTIIANIQQVFAFAEQWVNNYYLDIQNQEPHGVPSFDEQAFRNLQPGISIADILCNGAHPTSVIKHCLVSQLLASISFNGEGSSVSLLPAEFTPLVNAIQRSKADELKYHEPDRRLHALVGLLQRTSDVGILLFSQPSTFSFQWRISNSPSHDVEIAITPWVLKMSDENAQRIDPAQHMMKVKTEKTYFLAPPLSRNGILCATQNTPHPNLALEMPNANRRNHGDPSSYVVTRKAVAATGSPAVNLRSIAPHAPVTSEQHNHTAYELAGNDRQLGNRELVPRESRQPSQPVETFEKRTAFERRGYIQPSQRLQQDPHEQGVPLTTVQDHPLISPGAPVVHGRDGATNWQQESSVTTTAAF